MRKIKKCAVLFALCGSIAVCIPAKAADYNTIVKKSQTLKEEKKELQKEQLELNQQIVTLQKELKSNQNDLQAKEERVAKVRKELQKAKEKEHEQEEFMMKRIQFLYENDKNFLDALFTSSDMGDFLANAEYIEQMAAYDRKMLTELEDTRGYIERTFQELEVQKEALKEKEQELYKIQEDIEALVLQNSNQMKSIDAEIEKNIAELNQLMDESDIPGPWLMEGFGYLSNPCPSARISSEFGPRKAPTAGASTYHQGRDYAAPAGTPIVAAAEGTVVEVSYNSVRGNYIVIKHPNGLSTWYQHCTQVFVKKGDSIPREQKIATVGSTGVVSGAHLHFIVEEENGKLVDPRKYL